LAWFKAGGGVFRDDLLEIQDLRAKDAGRGIGKPASKVCTIWALIDSMQSQNKTYRKIQRYSLYLEI